MRVSYTLQCLLLSISFGLMGSMSLDSGVVWEDSKVQAVNSRSETDLRILLENPCDVLAQIYQNNMKTDIIIRCHQLYDELVIRPFQNWCSETSRSRSKRFEPSKMITMQFSAIVTGIGPIATETNFINTGKIFTSPENEGDTKIMLTDLEQQVRVLNHKHANQSASYRVAAQLSEQEHDYSELNWTGDMIEDTKHLVESLYLQNKAIAKAQRLWTLGIFKTDFLKAFNVSLPCTDEECPSDLQKPIMCQIYKVKRRDMLYLKLKTPFVVSNVTLMDSNPFKLMVKQENKTCAAEYVGPKQILFSRHQECVLNYNFLPTSNNYYFKLYKTDFQCNREFQDKTKYYQITECRSSKAEDHLDFVQVKAIRSTKKVYVYCPLSKITVDGNTKNCSSEVMEYSFSNMISINDTDFVLLGPT